MQPNQPQNAMKDANVDSFILVSEFPELKPHPQQPAYPGQQPLPEASDLNSPSSKHRMEAHPNTFAQDKKPEPRSQPVDFQKNSEGGALISKSTSEEHSKSLNTFVHKDLLISDPSPLIGNDTSQMDDSFAQSTKDLLKSLESNQQAAPDQNPLESAFAKLPDGSVHQGQPQQDPTPLPAKKEDPQEAPGLQLPSGNFPNSQAPYLQPLLSGPPTSAFPIKQPTSQLPNYPQGALFQSMETVVRMDDAPLVQSGVLLPGSTIGHANPFTSARSVPHLEPHQNPFNPSQPAQMPNIRANSGESPFLKTDSQQNLHGNSISTTPNSRVQTTPMTRRVTDPSTPQTPSSQQTNQVPPREPLSHERNAFPAQSYPSELQSPSIYNSTPTDPQPQYKEHPAPQPLNHGHAYFAQGHPPQAYAQQLYTHPSNQPPMHFPQPGTHEVQHVVYQNTNLPTTHTPPRYYKHNDNQQTSFDNSLQNHYHTNPQQQPSHHFNQHLQRVQSFPQVHPQHLNNPHIHGQFETPPRHPQGHQEQPSPGRQDYHTQDPNNYNSPHWHIQNADYRQAFTPRQQSNEAPQPIFRDLGSQSFNQAPGRPQDLTPDDSFYGQSSESHHRIIQQGRTPRQDLPSRDNLDSSFDSRHQVNILGTPNYNTMANPRARLIISQPRQMAPFPTLAYDPANIIQFIHYSQASENGFTVEKYLLSDAELVRFGGLLSAQESQPMIRSNNVEGIFIDFKKLAKIQAKFIGAFGRPEIMFQALADNCLIAHSEIARFKEHFAERGSGLYLLPIVKSPADTLILLVLYSNDDRDFDKVDEKRSYIRLLRYLTQLCPFNILAISQRDVELISPKEVDAETQNFFVFKPKTNKLTEDKCEVVEGKTIEPAAGSKILIATSSRSGFYTTTFHPAQNETIEDVHQWKGKENYEKTFKNCVINVGKLDGLETRTIYSFLSQHFYEEFRPILLSVDKEVDRLLEENKAEIERDIEERIRLRNTSLVINCMKYHGMPEYGWLPCALGQSQAISGEDAATILEAYKTDFLLNPHYKQKFDALHPALSKSTLLETEIICVEVILEKYVKCGLSNDARDITKSTTGETSFQIVPRSKQSVYSEAVLKLNKSKSVVGKYFTPWTHDLLAIEVMNLRAHKDFFNNYPEECAKDAVSLFKLLYRKMESYFTFETFRKEIYSRERSQFESLTKKNLFFQALKDCLERKEGTVVVNITALEEPTMRSFQLQYHKQNVIEAFNEYHVSQYELRKSDLDDARNDNHFVLRPTSKPLTSFQLPESNELVRLMLMKGNKLAAVVNFADRSEIRFYNIAQPNKVAFAVPFAKRVKKMDYNENRKKFVFYTRSKDDGTLYVYGISDDFYVRNESSIDLEARFGITDVDCLCLGNGSQVFLVDDKKSLRSIDYRNQSEGKINVRVADIKSILLVPGADCLLLMTPSGMVPYVIETDKVLPEIQLTSGTRRDNFVITKFESQTQLLFECEGRICSKRLKCDLSTETYKLENCAPDENQANAESPHERSVFDYFGFIYAKFAVYNPMEDLKRQSVEQKLVVYCSHTKTHSKDDEDKIRGQLAEIQKDIKKPKCESLKLAESAVFILPGENHSQLLYSQSSVKSLERWIQELISLVPIQIGRTENNQYIILNDGKPLQTSDAQNFYKVKEKISYGLFEALLSNWSKPVKVISSMGKQSTGKSYTLNHLSGGTFAIAGGRCTDGCWLSLKITDDCLYVLMDFEGLGSFERSEQEDMYLSIKNAALSNITLYKTGFSLDKETDQMFNRFNQGANLLKGDDKIFKGLFCVLVKDIDQRDVREVVGEFTGKIEKIIQRGEKKDFITTMYGSGYGIFTFDFFTNAKYYSQMESLAKYIQRDIQSPFGSGKDFLDLLKTVQAKLAIQDFTSLSRQDIDARIYILGEHYVNALMLGNLASHKDSRAMFALKSYDDADKAVKEELEVEVEAKAKGLDAKALKLVYSDPDINMFLDSLDFIEVLEKSYRRTQENHLTWSGLLREFVKAAVAQRVTRVQTWVAINLEKWASGGEFKEPIANFKQQVSHKAKEIEMRFSICSSNCSSCFAACTLLEYHTGSHSCGQDDHKCRSVCAYCQGEGREEPCSLDFGHQEGHICSSYGHTCGQACKYSKCQWKCMQTTNHEGSHVCGLPQHICPDKCSLATCLNHCQIPADKEHTVHKCVNDQCLTTCEVKGCQNRCECNDHFHGHEALSKQFKVENGVDPSQHPFVTAAGKALDIDFHCCGITHPCTEDCSEPGLCKVLVERKVVQEEFKGKKQKFTFQKQFENVGNKLRCCKVIPEYQKEHDGRHVHSQDQATVHTCETRCPTCNNICEKHVNHPGRHDTAHGNMEKCSFVSNQTDIDVGDHKYVVGESAMAEMCHMFCKRLGRGHIHLVECGQTKEKCPNRDEGKRRHETCQYGPDVHVSKDEVLHEVYWDLINFEDPCQKDDIEKYGECPFYCGSKDHAKDKDKKYCKLKLWHKRVNNLAEVGKSHGHMSTDGHYYDCNHNISSKGYHFIFCLDKSGSMEGKPWAELSVAVNEFCKSRASSTLDRLSIVTFDETQLTTCENIPFTQFDASKHLLYRGGGTHYAPAISLCHDIFKRNINKDMTPIFIFMSDGDNDSGDAELKSLSAEFGPKGLQVFLIAFGKNLPRLEQFSKLINGTYTNSIDGVALKGTFREISSQLPTVIAVAPSKK